MKPAHIEAARPAGRLHSLALAIQAGDLSAWPATYWPLWETADKQSAADELLHEDNPFELDFLLARQECHDRWREADLPEDYDLDSFIADRANWNGPDTIYARGMGR